MTRCCSDTKVCLKYDYKFVDNLAFLLKLKISEYSNKKIASLFNKYYCNEDIDSNIVKLNVLLKSLNRIKLSFLHIDEYCLPEYIVQSIIEKAIKEVGSNCGLKRVDITVDDSQLSSYLLSGSVCVSYESWNKFSHMLCDKLGFTIKAEKQKCDLSFDITRKVISCNLLYSLQVKKELCDLGYSIKKSANDCKIEYKLLMEKHPDCDLEYKAYLSFVRNHSLSYPILDEIYESGLTLLEVDGEATLCTPINNYKLTEITPTSLQELLNEGFLISLNKHDIKQDFTK